MEKIAFATRYLILIVFLFINNIYAQEIVRTPEQERDYNGYFQKSNTGFNIDSVIKYENYSEDLNDSVKTGCWEFEYDAQGRLTSQTAWSWTGDSWYGTYKLSYTYNVYDKIEQKQAYEVWQEGDGWRKGRRTDYTYDNDGMLEESREYFFEGINTYGQEVWHFDKGSDYSFTEINGEYYFKLKKDWISLGEQVIGPGVTIEFIEIRNIYDFDYTPTSYTLKESYKGIYTRKYIFEHDHDPSQPSSRDKYKWDKEASEWGEIYDRYEYTYGFGVTKKSVDPVNHSLVKSIDTQTKEFFKYELPEYGYSNNTDFFRIPGSNKIIYSEYSTSSSGFGKFENREFYIYVDGNALSEKAVDNSGIVFYPNPTSDELRISNPLGEKMNIFIYDSKGALVLEASENKKTILLNLNHIKSGVYFINCQTNSGFTKSKIIKE